MKRLEAYTRPLMWSIAVLLAAVAAGCSNGSDPILGGGTVVSSVVNIIPGATCSVSAGATIPTVTMSDPTSGNQFVTTSTGVLSGKQITATFSLAMNATTITATSFTLKPVGGAVLVPASIVYNTSTKVATLTTSSALLANTSYTANITTAVKSAAVPGVALSCGYEWTFKTAAVAGAGVAPVNLGLATPSGISSYAGLSNTGATKINGDTLIGPTNTCNLQSFLITDGPGFGTCGGFPPTKNAGDVVITPVYDQGITSVDIFIDLRLAFLSIIPSTGFPHGTGSLDGGTPIAAPTTLGTGSTGQNTFTPGVYYSNTSIQIQGNLTLDGGGDQNARFVFQSASSLTTIAPTNIILINGAKASNVWWAVGSSATLGAGTKFQGNILADTSITMVTGTTSCGRLLAGAFTNSGAFTFDTNTVSVPGNANAPATDPANVPTICQ